MKEHFYILAVSTIVCVLGLFCLKILMQFNKNVASYQGLPYNKPLLPTGLHTN